MSIESNKLMNLADGKVLYDDLRNRVEKKANNIERNVSIPAEVMTISDGADGMPMKVVAAIDPVQNLHGYANPWSGGGGGNLAKPYAGTKNTVELTVKSNGRMNLNGTNSSDSSTYIANGSPTYVLHGGTYTLSIYGRTIRLKDETDGTYPYGSASIPVTESPFTFTAIEGHEYSICWVIAGSATYSNVEVYYQLEVGETATEWKPYSNICPISGWTEANISCFGKNILNPETMRADIKGGTSYTFSCNVTWDGVETIANIFGDIAYDNGTHSITGSPESHYPAPESGSVTRESITFNAEYDGYVVFGVGTGVQADDFQCEAGTSATEYEPYNTYNIKFPAEEGTVYGGTLTINKDGSADLVVDRAFAHLGDWTWSYASNYGFRAASTSTTSGKKFLRKANGQSRANKETFCDSYRISNFTTAAGFKDQDNVITIGNTFSTYNVIVGDKKFNGDASAFIAEMGDTEIVYTLSSEYVRTYHFTVEQIRTMTGTINIAADTGDILSIDYSAPNTSGMASSLSYGDKILPVDARGNIPVDAITEVLARDAVFIRTWDITNPTTVNSNASAVINAAMVEANTKGKHYVVVPAGEYWLTTTIYLKSDVILKGCGMDATILKIADDCDIDAIRVAEPVNNSGIMDLTIDGNRIQNYSTFANGHHGNAINVWLHYGIIERVRTNWVFKHSLLLNYDTGNSDDGLGFEPEHQNDMGNLNKVLWCDFRDSLLQGIMWGWRTMDSWMCYTNVGSHAANLCLEGGTSRFIGNHFDGDGDNGIGPEYNIYCGDGCTAMLFDSNIFENTQKQNIYFRQPSYSNQTMTITFANNIIRTCSKTQNEQYANVYISGYSASVPATEVILSNNQILNPDTNANNGYAGIHLVYCKNSKITGNTFFNVGTDDVVLDDCVNVLNDSKIVEDISTLNKPITPNRQHIAAFYGLAKLAGIDLASGSDTVGVYPDNAKVAIQKMLGIYQAPWELIREDTVTHATSELLDITTDDNGQPFELTDIRMLIEVPPQETDFVITDYTTIRTYWGTSNVGFVGIGNSTYTITDHTARYAMLVEVEWQKGMSKMTGMQLQKQNGRTNVQAGLYYNPTSANREFIIGDNAFDKIRIPAFTGTLNYRLYGKRKWT